MTKKKEGAKMGRPPLPVEDRKSCRLTIRLKADERARIQAEADRLGVSLADALLRRWRK